MLVFFNTREIATDSVNEWTPSMATLEFRLGRAWD